MDFCARRGAGVSEPGATRWITPPVQPRGAHSSPSTALCAAKAEDTPAQHDDLVIAADVFETAREMDRWIFHIPHAIFRPRARDARRRIEQAFATWIVAGPFDQRADRVLHMLGYGRFPDRVVFVGPHQAAHAVIFLLAASECVRGGFLCGKVRPLQMARTARRAFRDRGARIQQWSPEPH